MSHNLNKEIDSDSFPNKDHNLSCSLSSNILSNLCEPQSNERHNQTESAIPVGPQKVIETKLGQKIVNLSEFDLDSHQIAILSKGLKFCPSQVRKDPGENKRELGDFHRKIRIKEFFSKIPQEHFTIPKSSYDVSTRPQLEVTETIGNLFPFDKIQKFAKLKQESNWNPPKGSNNLETFILMNEITTQGLKNDKNPCQNITPAQRESLKKLSKNKHITIKQADKGGAIVLMNTRDYISEANRQLSDHKTYKLLTKDITLDHNKEIALQIQSMVKGRDITERMGKTLLNPNPRTAQIYFLPKIHKCLDNPPGRPIVSATGCPTERISAFVDHFLNPLVKEAKSYVKDTNDFIQKIDALPPLKGNTIIGSLDVTSLYTCIPNEEGIRACEIYLRESRSEWYKPSNDSLLKLLQMVLEMNNFQFNGKNYLQVGGVSMGTRTAPSFANLFMRHLEDKLIDGHHLKPKVWYRFVDDVFIVWEHGEDTLKEWVQYLNTSHSSIKFTLEHSIQEINFLDTLVKKDNNNKLYTDLYTKKTDTNSYLHYESAHPPHCKKSLPYSQLLRIKQICTNQNDCERHSTTKINEFKQKGYPIKLLKESKTKVDIKGRESLFHKPDSKDDQNKTTFMTTTYRPGLHKFTNAIRENWKILARSTTTKEMYNNGLKIGYKRPKNLKDILVRAKTNYNLEDENQGKKRKKCKRLN